MKGNLQEALKKVDMTYDQLQTIAIGIVKAQTAEADALVKQAESVKDLTDSQIRNLILLISIKSYNLAEPKELAALKLECATSIKKEEYAKVFAATDGTVATKENTAFTETTDELMSEAIYDVVAALLKTKVDELHRLVDSLKSVLMSRMQEAKLTAQVNTDKAAFE